MARPARIRPTPITFEHQDRPMSDRIERAREAVKRAAELTDDATVQKQLHSIDEGLEEMTHSAKEDVSDTDREEAGGAVKTGGDVPHGENLEEVEMKLAGLGDDADSAARRLIQDARDHLDGYRREYTRDW